LLTIEFGKSGVVIGFKVLESTDGNYQSPIVVFLMDSGKYQLKEAYIEEPEFKEDAIWQFIY
jgi:hypothetical protein